MHDFKAFVRGHLLPGLPPAQELKIVEELAAQLEESYEVLVASGASDDEAWNDVRRGMPDTATLVRDLLDAEPAITRLAHPEHGPFAGPKKRRLAAWLRDELWTGVAGDLRSAFRRLVKERSFTAATLLTLAVCLGANAAVFTIVYAVLLRPLPVADPDRLVALGDVYPTITPDDILSNTAPSYFDRLEALDALESQAMLARWSDTISVDGVAQEIRGMRVTPSLFRVTGVQPAMGRAFSTAEGEIGAEQRIILSHGLWQRLYGGDPSVVGRDLRLGWTGRLYTIVGVMPREFSLIDPSVEFWIPLAFTPAQRSDDARTRYGFYHVGRLRPGATIEQVKAQADAVTAATIARFPQFGLAELGMYTAVTPLHQALTRDVRGILYLLWGGALFVLLIGTMNIANLALARASVRVRELATRLALGAGSFAVARQLALEGIVLAAAGGLAGLGVGAGILRGLGSSGIERIPIGEGDAAFIQMHWTVIALTLGVSALIGMLLGLFPAATLRSINVSQVLAEGSRSGTGGRAARLFRRGLIVTQVASSVVLLVGAGLLLTSFRNLLAVDAGFDAERVVTATIFPPPSRYETPQAVATLTDRILEAVRAIPGVEAAGITSNIALSGHTSPMTVARADRIPQPGEALILPSVVSVTPGYFEAMTTPLVRGRRFTDSDRDDTLPVAIVDERLAARLWPAEDPIGKDIDRGSEKHYTVVGVVRNVRLESLSGRTEPAGAVYFPHTQAPPLGRLRWLAIKVKAGPAEVMRAARTAVAVIDPSLPLSDIQTMTDRRSQSLIPQKLAMGLAGLFGAVALFLSVVGVYCVLAYVVAQRTREIGIRIAVGSTVRGIFRLVFKEGLTLIVGGLTLGLTGALALGRVLVGQVFGIEPSDPFVLGAVIALTGVIALLGCVSPALRATRVDPLTALNTQ